MEKILKAIEKEINEYNLAENLTIDELVVFVEQAHEILSEVHDLLLTKLK
jgi:hypothetical protein